MCRRHLQAQLLPHRGDYKLMIMKRKNNILILLTALSAFAVVICLCVLALARSGIRSSLGGNETFELKISAVQPSLSHGLRIEFQVLGHSEIHSAQWRLYPFGEIITSK